MRRLLLLAVFAIAFLPAAADQLEEVSLPIVPFVFDHEPGIQVGLELRLTSGVTFGLMGMAGRVSVDGMVTPPDPDALVVWPAPRPVAFHEEHSASGVAFKIGIPVWKRKAHAATPH